MANPLCFGMNYESMEALMAPPLVAWLFGHTHFNADFLVQRSEGATVLHHGL